MNESTVNADKYEKLCKNDTQLMNKAMKKAVTKMSLARKTSPNESEERETDKTPRHPDAIDEERKETTLNTETTSKLSTSKRERARQKEVQTKTSASRPNSKNEKLWWDLMTDPVPKQQIREAFNGIISVN